MKCLRASFLATWLVLPATADLLYNNTIPTNTSSGIGPESVCGPAGCTQVFGIAVDDVLIPASRDPGNNPLGLTQVTVQILGATQTTFNLWNFSVAADGAPSLAHQLLGSQTPTLSGEPQTISFGNGSSVFAVVQPVAGVVPGYDLLYLGLNATDTADWNWANGPDFNLPTAYFYDPNINEIFLNTSVPPEPPNFSYYIQAQGVVEPEPAFQWLIALVVAGLAWKSRSISRGRARPPEPGF